MGQQRKPRPASQPPALPPRRGTRKPKPAARRKRRSGLQRAWQSTRAFLTQGDLGGLSPLKCLSIVGVLAAVALAYYFIVPGAFGSPYYTVVRYDDTKASVISGQTTAGYLLTFHNTDAGQFDVKVPRVIKTETPLGATFRDLKRSHVKGTAGDGRVEYEIACNEQEELDAQCNGSSVHRAWMNYIGMERAED